MTLDFIFLADCQLGAYASFSGLTEADVAEYAANGMRIWSVPPTAGFDWDARQFELAISIANATRPAFVVMGGDMVDDLTNEDQYEALRSIAAGLDRDIPMQWVPGNHDIAVDTVTPTPHSIDKYRELFGPDYYAFDAGDARFIVLNTVVLDHPEEVPDELAAQMAFLERELTAAFADTRVAILFGHHPLFTADAEEADSYWNVPTEQRNAVLELVHRHGVRAMFAGHWHRNSYARHGDFEMVTSGPVGYPLGDDPSGYRTVTVADRRISHEYHPLEP